MARMAAGGARGWKQQQQQMGNLIFRGPPTVWGLGC